MEPGHESIHAYVSAIERDAVTKQGVALNVAHEAARATLRALGDEAYGEHLQRRAWAYYWTVVRRRTVRDGSASNLAARFVLASVVADLDAAGRSPAQVWEELRRGWADKVPGVVLEEYRQRLCA